MDDYIIETTLNVGDFFEYNGEQFRYFGNVQDQKNIPNCDCCYSIGDTLYIRKVEKPLDLEIKPNDKMLLIKVKKAFEDIHRNQINKIVYSVPENVQYEFVLQEIPELKCFNCIVQTAIIDGKKCLLHNEISISFIIVDDKVVILNGWHTGTEDFTFSKEEGDDCEAYVEEYHPGLLKQLNEKLKEMKYL